MSMAPFPVGLPTEAIMIIIDKLRGSEVQNNDLILAAWNLAGYALQQVSPVTPKTMLMSDVKLEELAFTNQEAIESLESLLPKGEGEEVGKLPWAKILRVAIKIIIGLII